MAPWAGGGGAGKGGFGAWQAFNGDWRQQDQGAAQASVGWQSAAQQAQQRPQAAAASGVIVPASTSISRSPPIVVGPCANNPTVSNIVKGSYTASGENHGKPVYKKDIAGGTVSVLIYFWDERDGPSFSGWWFGPKVGGDQVWAYNDKTDSHLPPQTEWKVPWDGEIDPSFKLQYGANTQAANPGSGAVVQGRMSHMVQPSNYMNQRMQQQEEIKKKQEQREQEAMARQAELKKKREDEEGKRKEQAAALAVRKAIQKVRTANPDNYDELRAQLEEAQANNLEAMGSQAEKVSAEAEQALEAAQKRIDDINEKKVNEEKRKVELEQKRKEDVEKIEQFVADSKSETAALQDKVKEAEESAKSLEDAESESSPDKMFAAAEATEKSIESTIEEAQKTRKSIIEKQKEFGDNEAIRKVRRDIVEMTTKLAQGVRSLEKLSAVVKTAREKAAGRASAFEKLQSRKTEFAKYDRDKDGKLNRKEVEAYCKAVLEYVLPSDAMDSIVKKLEPLTYDKFRSLHQKSFIAKSEILAREARAEEEAKLKAIQDKKDAVKAILVECEEELKSAMTSENEAEAKARPLIKESELGADEIKEAANAVDELVGSINANLEAYADKLKRAKEACLETEELKDFDKKDVMRLDAQEAKIKARLIKINAATKLAREKAARKAFAEIDGKRAEAVTSIRAKMTEDGKNATEFFESINGGSAISKDKFAAFIKGLAGMSVLAEGIPEKLFEHIAGDATEIDQARFLEMVRLYYKVVKATVLSEEHGIKSKTVRRLELGEVLEAMEAPKKDEASGVSRVRCHAVQDDAEGYVTLAGNQGTAFLEPGGNFYSCVKETLLTDGLSVQDSKTVRRLAKGEVLEVLEFPKKDASTDVKRIKGKAKLDGAIGWTTVASTSGTAFLEPC